MRLRSIVLAAFVAALLAALPGTGALGVEPSPEIEEGPLLWELPESDPGELGLATDLYAWDPLRLVAGDDVRKYSLGTDTFEVWVCRTDDTFPVSLSSAVAYLSNNVTPYFSYLSEGKYTIRFEEGGVVSAGYPEYGSSGGPGDGCLEEAASAAAIDGNDSEGAIVIATNRTQLGYGGPGFTGPSAVYGDWGPTAYPENGREIFVGAEAVVDVGVYGGVIESLITHEIGHTLHWSHSFSGLEISSNGIVWEYDNATDVMSGNTTTEGSPAPEPDSYGTVGLNRYAAGWIHPDDVVVHRGGTTEFVLGATGSATDELAIIPLSGEGHYFALDSRVRTSQDVIPAAWQGVTIHEVDQRNIDHFPDDPYPGCSSGPFLGVCYGADRRVRQIGDGPYQLDHVLGVGDRTKVGGVEVTVLAEEENGYRIRLSGQPAGVSRFSDTSGSVFEADVTWLADQGITRGCNPPLNSLFCPDDVVTRGQMAAFLVRALGLTDTGTSSFTDTAESVFADDIARLAAAGITRGCNPPDNTRFCPDDRVTRGQMAAFLVRAFGLTDGSGAAFTDTGTSVFAVDIARLATAGITRGCNPPDNTRFCPTDSVTRGQMAAFLHRAESYLP